MKESNPEPKQISWRDREQLGLARLGEDINRHFTWGRGSALSRLTENKSAANPGLVVAHRAACNAVANSPLGELESSAKAAEKAASDFGVKVSALKPGLDAKALSFGAGTISLHNDKVPLRNYGLGSRRLAALAVQQIGISTGGIVLIDEIEHGLEPHRIRELIKKICRKDEKDQANSNAFRYGQVFMTTHSPTPIMALPAECLRFVQSSKGKTTINKVAPESVSSVQSIVRTRAPALLGRKIIVCEGKTEEGLCWILDDYWAEKHGGEGLILRGIVPVQGGGRNNGPSTAIELSRLGYKVLFFGEEDEPVKPDKMEMAKHQVVAITWTDKLSTEERIANDLPLSSLQKFIDAAVKEKGEMAVLKAICDRVGFDFHPDEITLSKWLAKGFAENDLRNAIGIAAKKADWFKNITLGKELGHIVAKALPNMKDKPTAKTLEEIEHWIYDDDG